MGRHWRGRFARGLARSGAQSTINISGNNVNAYLDTNNDDRADRAARRSPLGNF